MQDITGSRFLRMAGSDGFQRDLNKSATPAGTPGSAVGGDFSTAPVEGSQSLMPLGAPVGAMAGNTNLPSGGTGKSGSFDYSMFSVPDTVQPSSLQGPGSYENQVSREKSIRNSNFIGSKIGDESYTVGHAPTQSTDGASIAMKYIQLGQATQGVDLAGLDQRINQRPLYHQAKSDLEGLKTYGDHARWSKSNLPVWQMPEPMEAVEKPDFEGMYNRTKSDLDKLEL